MMSLQPSETNNDDKNTKLGQAQHEVQREETLTIKVALPTRWDYNATSQRRAQIAREALRIIKESQPIRATALRFRLDHYPARDVWYALRILRRRGFVRCLGITRGAIYVTAITTTE